MSAVGLAGGDAALLFGSRNQIDFVVDNETDYELKAESTVFADWGDFSRYPSTVCCSAPNSYFSLAYDQSGPSTQ